jgi:hypothetical protein
MVCIFRLDQPNFSHFYPAPDSCKGLMNKKFDASRGESRRCFLQTGGCMAIVPFKKVESQRQPVSWLLNFQVRKTFALQHGDFGHA